LPVSSLQPLKHYLRITNKTIYQQLFIMTKYINMFKKITLALALLSLFAACSKKSVDTPPATVPERLEMTPATKGIMIGETASFALKFFNNVGQEAALPAGISWSSSNTAIATISAQGVVTGKGSGQTTIRATYNTISATALLTVVADNTQLASIMVMPADIQEVKLNESATLTAVGKNINGNTINGLSFTWVSNDNGTVEVSSGGSVTGKVYGTANVSASSLNIQSAPVMVQVIRRGNFSGSGSAGAAKLKIENGILKLQTTPDFSVAGGPPDLRIYLGNNNNNINGAVEVGTLAQRTGAQSWNVAAPTGITQFRYAIVWCKQFGGTYGVADLGN
jgi:Bacterial Ig-like domain (group 2)/Electron transfer DM13